MCGDYWSDDFGGGLYVDFGEYWFFDDFFYGVFELVMNVDGFDGYGVFFGGIWNEVWLFRVFSVVVWVGVKWVWVVVVVLVVLVFGWVFWFLVWLVVLSYVSVVGVVLLVGWGWFCCFRWGLFGWLLLLFCWCCGWLVGWWNCVCVRVFWLVVVFWFGLVYWVCWVVCWVIVGVVCGLVCELVWCVVFVCWIGLLVICWYVWLGWLFVVFVGFLFVSCCVGWGWCCWLFVFMVVGVSFGILVGCFCGFWLVLLSWLVICCGWVGWGWLVGVVRCFCCSCCG